MRQARRHTRLSLATIMFCMALFAGCVTHSTTREHSDTSTQIIYQISEQEAFITILDIYAVELPKQSVDDVIEGNHRGYNATARYWMDWTNHRVLVIPAKGVDKNGQEVHGYWYDIHSSGSRAIENPLRNKRIRDMLQERLGKTAIVVTKVQDGEYETDGKEYLGLKRDARDIKASANDWKKRSTWTGRRDRDGSEAMNRRAFLSVLSGSLLAAPLAVGAQQAAKIARIGLLGNNEPVGGAHIGNAHLLEAFRQGLRDLGYVEGRNVVIEYRWAEGKVERLPALAAELVALKVDVILATTVLTAVAAKQAIKTIPIVFFAAADPIRSGLVSSLARPGGNVTGLSVFSPELIGKRLELLKQAVPGISRVAVLWEPDGGGERTDKDMLKRAEVAGQALGCDFNTLRPGVPPISTGLSRT